MPSFYHDPQRVSAQEVWWTGCAGARPCQGDVSFDVWPSGLNRQSDDDFSYLKSILNGYNEVNLWIVVIAMP